MRAVSAWPTSSALGRDGIEEAQCPLLGVKRTLGNRRFIDLDLMRTRPNQSRSDLIKIVAGF